MQEPIDLFTLLQSACSDCCFNNCRSAHKGTLAVRLTLLASIASSSVTCTSLLLADLIKQLPMVGGAIIVPTDTLLRKQVGRAAASFAQLASNMYCSSSDI